MRVFTAHLRPQRMPVLVTEGWSWAAFWLGPLWLFARRAWIPAILLLAAFAALFALAPSRFWGPLSFGLALLSGLMGRDMVRWSLALRGYTLAHVLTARNEESALARLYAARTDLLADIK